MTDFPADEPPTRPAYRPAIAAEQRRAAMERILAAWDRQPQYRLGQLLVNAVGVAADEVADRAGVADLNERDRDCLNMLFLLEDRELVEMLERWRR